MKKIILLSFCSLLLSVQDISAQEESDGEEFETIFPKGLESGGYGAFEMKYGHMWGSPGMFLGGRGGWIINHVFVIGGGGCGFVNNRLHEVSFYDETRQSMIDTTVRLMSGYGGLHLEAILWPRKAVHISVPVLIGAGGASLHMADDLTEETSREGSNYEYMKMIEQSPYFIIEPGLNIELNLFSFMRIAVGGTYRFVSGLDMENLGSPNLSGPTANLMFKFGSF